MNDLTFTQLNKLSKNHNPEGNGLRLAILGDSATQLLVKGIKGYSVHLDLDLDIYEADYDQLDLEISSNDSGLYKFKPDIIYIFYSVEKLHITYLKSSIDQKTSIASNKVNVIQNQIKSIQSKLVKSKIIISNFPEKSDLLFANYANNTSLSWLYQIRKLNLDLMDLCQQTGNLFILDNANLSHQKGRTFSFDPKVYIKSDIITALDYIPILSYSLVNYLKTLSGKFAKCLILDLDNTTWGGIIGDDGIEKIHIGDFGIGKAFTLLQLWAKNLRERGIILAICSKNTESVAKEPFEQHPEMILKLEDIAVFVANWENKADNIKYIQSVLNIGFDSMVFLDDNPFERNLVREMIPEVIVPELPKDPSDYIPYLETLNLFETNSYTALDNSRTKKYQEEAQRKKEETNYTSITDFLRSLEMKATIEDFNGYNTPRVAQLSQRSNQFNLRTVRYQEANITNIGKSSNHKSFAISLSDRYGEYGIISVVILEKIEPDTWFIDTWIMSCRVLKRDVEKFALNRLVHFLKQEKAATLIGERIPTKKNELVKDHYKNLGFIEHKSKWQLSVSTFVELKTEIQLNES